MDSNSACVNASACSDTSTSASVSPGPCWRAPTRHGRRCIKKTPQTDARDDTVDLWSLDEVHFQQQEFPMSYVDTAGKAGTRSCIIIRRKSVGYFAAVQLAGWPVSVSIGAKAAVSTANPFGCFWKQLHEASPRCLVARVEVAISDNAQYHRSKLHLSWRQHQERQFRLDFLPPYSPDLNPIERVWKLTRRLCLHNRYFGFLDSVVDAVEKQFADWIKPNETLRRLCAIT